MSSRRSTRRRRVLASNVFVTETDDLQSSSSSSEDNSEEDWRPALTKAEKKRQLIRKKKRARGAFLESSDSESRNSSSEESVVGRESRKKFPKRTKWDDRMNSGADKEKDKSSEESEAESGASVQEPKTSQNLNKDPDKNQLGVMPVQKLGNQKTPDVPIQNDSDKTVKAGEESVPKSATPKKTGKSRKAKSSDKTLETLMPNENRLEQLGNQKEQTTPVDSSSNARMVLQAVSTSDRPSIPAMQSLISRMAMGTMKGAMYKKIGVLNDKEVEPDKAIEDECVSPKKKKRCNQDVNEKEESVPGPSGIKYPMYLNNIAEDLPDTQLHLKRSALMSDGPAPKTSIKDPAKNVDIEKKKTQEIVEFDLEKTSEGESGNASEPSTPSPQLTPLLNPELSSVAPSASSSKNAPLLPATAVPIINTVPSSVPLSNGPNKESSVSTAKPPITANNPKSPHPKQLTTGPPTQSLKTPFDSNSFSAQQTTPSSEPSLPNPHLQKPNAIPNIDPNIATNIYYLINGSCKQHEDDSQFFVTSVGRLGYVLNRSDVEPLLSTSAYQKGAQIWFGRFQIKNAATNDSFNSWLQSPDFDKKIYQNNSKNFGDNKEKYQFILRFKNAHEVVSSIFLWQMYLNINPPPGFKIMYSIKSSLIYTNGIKSTELKLAEFMKASDKKKIFEVFENLTDDAKKKWKDVARRFGYPRDFWKKTTETPQN